MDAHNELGLSRWHRLAARVRMPVAAIGAIGVVATPVLEVARPWRLAALVTFIVGAALYIRLGTPRGNTVDLGPPVTGRWQAVNSPSTRVPSHGIHAWGQTHAIDLVHDPEDGSRPTFATTPVTRPPEDFPGFGRPIFAPVDGVVVTARDGLRDHRSRTSPLGLVWLALESVREVLGPPGVVGNHLVIREPGGAFVLLAHLRRGSLRVDPGTQVARGDVVAECGNSGNSTEPHLHLQTMDRASPWIAAGLPIEFEGQPPPETGEATTFEPTVVG